MEGGRYVSSAYNPARILRRMPCWMIYFGVWMSFARRRGKRVAPCDLLLLTAKTLKSLAKGLLIQLFGIALQLKYKTFDLALY
jgi:hypothetical protein